MQEVRHMVILKGIVLLVCTGMVVGMYSNYVTSVVAKTKRRVMVKPGFRCICRICCVCRTKRVHWTDRIHSISYNKLYLSFLLY